MIHWTWIGTRFQALSFRSNYTCVLKFSISAPPHPQKGLVCSYWLVSNMGHLCKGISSSGYWYSDMYSNDACDIGTGVKSECHMFSDVGSTNLISVCRMVLMHVHKALKNMSQYVLFKCNRQQKLYMGFNKWCQLWDHSSWGFWITPPDFNYNEKTTFTWKSYIPDSLNDA